MPAITTGHTNLEQTMDRLCSSCAGRERCGVESAARIYWPEHPLFPGEWQEDHRGWRCSIYQPTRLVGTGRIDDPAQVEMFSA